MRCSSIRVPVHRCTTRQRYPGLWPFARGRLYSITHAQTEAINPIEKDRSGLAQKSIPKNARNQDIVPGDLKATLQAHRLSNQTRLFKKVYVDSYPQKDSLIRPFNNDEDWKGASESVNPELEAKGGHQTWYRYVNDGVADFGDKLDTDIEEIVKMLSPSPEESAFREALAQHIMAIVQKEYPEIQYNATGSRHTVLARNASDIDIGFSFPSISMFPRCHPQAMTKEQREIFKQSRMDVFVHLRNMLQLLQDTGMFKPIFLRTGRYLLLHIQHLAGVNIELVHSAPTTSAITYVNEYSTEYPQSRSVYMILRSAVAARGLDSQRFDGLGSYPLFMMVVAAFKLQSISRNESVGKALLLVLKFWAAFDLKGSCVLFEPASVVSKKSWTASMSDETANDPTKRSMFRLTRSTPRNPDGLVLQDPASLETNASRACRKMKDIQNLFKSFSLALSHGFDGSLKPGTTHPLYFMIRKAPLLAYRQRKNLHRWIEKNKDSQYHGYLIKKYRLQLSAEQESRES